METVRKIGQYVSQTEITNPLIHDKQIVKLAIQGAPGTKFKIDDVPITIGYSGYYELEDNDIVISEIDLDEDNNINQQFYIDYVYLEEVQPND